MKNICSVLSEMANEQPDAPALVDRYRGETRSLSFAELDTATAGGASELLASGLNPGDTILFFHPVSIELYTALLSVFRAGMTAMFVDPSAGRAFIDACCELRQPQAFFGSPKAHLLRLASRAVRRIPKKFHSRAAWLPGSRRWSPETAEPAAISEPEAPALITFTSGSTGRPKAVARSHEFLIAQHQALESSLQLRPGETDLITLPVFALANLGSGLTSVLADTDLAKPGEADAEKVAHQIREDQVTRVAASPAFFESLLENGDSLKPIRRIATGGAPVFPPLLDRLAAAAPEAEIYAVYGSTEAEPIAHIAHNEISADDIEQMRGGRGLLVGTPVPEIQLQIIPDQWGQPIAPSASETEFLECRLPANTIGEIVVTGDHVLRGYLEGIGDEETKIHVGEQVWHRTGDAGRLGDDGRLWLLGRCAAKIARGKLYPFAVECALSFEPGLRRCAAVEHEGERVLALEFLSGTNTKEALAGIRDRVAWADFDQLLDLDQIPVDRRHQAKVDYPRLYQVLAKRLG